MARTSKRLNRFARLAVFAALLAIPLVGCVSVTPAPEVPVANAGPFKTYATGSLAHMKTWAEPRPVENIEFRDAQGKAIRLDSFKGKVVFVYVWATWLSPAAQEIPELAKLQSNYADKGLAIVPLSINSESSTENAARFIDQNAPLSLYLDLNFEAVDKLRLISLPETIILDKQGREVARIEGTTNWDRPEVKAFIERLLSEAPSQ